MDDVYLQKNKMKPMTIVNTQIYNIYIYNTRMKYRVLYSYENVIRLKTVFEVVNDDVGV